MLKSRLVSTPEPGLSYLTLSLQEALKHYALVFDAIYTPKLTTLLREAQEAGSTIVYGTEMFINQAFVQFERFTGLPGKIKLANNSNPIHSVVLLFCELCFSYASFFLLQHQSNSLEMC